jgi:hypothetical protein
MAYTISAEWKLFVPGVQEAAADMPVKWNNGLANNAVAINDRRKASIPDDGTFNVKVAIPSNLGFSPMIDAAFVSKSERTASMIAQAHLDNLKKAFGKWSDSLDYAFETVAGVECKRFKDAVSAKQGNWAIAVADKTLRMTGDKVRGRGVAPIAAYLLVADARVMGMLRPSDIWIAGAPTNIARDGERPSFKTAIQQALIQTGIAIIASGFDATMITAQNTILETLLNGLEDIVKCDPFDNTPVAPDKPHCLWVHDPATGQFYLHGETGLT